MKDSKKKCKKILFVLKKRNLCYGPSFGLSCSCSFVCKFLKKHCAECKTVEVIDGNGIDREIHKFKPDFVIIEAIWCSTAKLEELIKLHPTVKKWSVRLHSRIPFLQNEGSAIFYIKQYKKLSQKYPKFNVSVNHLETQKELNYATQLKADYLPNIYVFEDTNYTKDRHPEILDISSFGAVRVQKNILIQAIAAIKFADLNKKELHFHINSNRNEEIGQSTLKNLVSLFEDSKHKLIKHEWMTHEDFIKLVRQMDICMGVSNTETFCITIADAIVNNIPVVASDAVEIVSFIFQADPNQVDDIISKLDNAYSTRFIHLQALNKRNLKKYNEKSEEKWLEYLLD